MQGPYLIKVCDDLVEQPQTLHPHVVAIQLDVEVVEVGDGCEHDSHLGVGLVIQILQGHGGQRAPRSSPAHTWGGPGSLGHAALSFWEWGAQERDLREATRSEGCVRLSTSSREDDKNKVLMQVF